MLSNAQDQRLSRAASGDGNRSPSLPMTPLLRKSGAFHSSANENFKVVIRARPPLPRELNGERPFQNIISVDDEEKVITVSENLAAVDAQRLRLGLAAADGALAGGGGEAGAAGPYATHVFTFDHVYEQGASQEKVYRTTAAGVVGSALEGYNATIFAYGQTGTGKTYTMEGFQRGMDAESRGLIPRAIEQIFGHIQAAASPRTRFLVRASYLQIYNEVISDLLKPERNNLAIREDPRRGVFVEGLSEWVVRSPAEIYGLMERGAAVRATGATNMNEVSSRSHAVFIIIAEQSSTYYVDKEGHELPPEAFAELMQRQAAAAAAAAAGGAAAAAAGAGAGGSPAGAGAAGGAAAAAARRMEEHVRQAFKVGKLNLVDLAGSERVRLSGATGVRLRESRKINQSLSALGNVIAALTDAKGRQHIPYRDSKLTRILEDSLGGNCKTTMMAMISPALEAMVETVSTLKFANRAKNIKNEAKVNEDLDQKSLLRKYERELRRLRAELDERARSVVDQRRLLELDEQRRRAERDKMAAIRALEQRSLEFLREKEEKRRLEEKIHRLTSQIRMGGHQGPGGGGGGGGGNEGGGGGGDQEGGGGGGGRTPDELQLLVKAEQARIRREYAQRLQAIERERESIEEEKAQVDRYKHLLLKQRDIMIALTQRLNERDEQILALQDEVDAYDRHNRQLEEKLDAKTAALIHLQRVTLEAAQASPVKSAALDRALGPWAGDEAPSSESGRSTPAPGGAAAAATAGAGGGGGPLAPPPFPRLVSNASHSGASTPAAAASVSPPPAGPAAPPQQLMTTPQFLPYGAGEGEEGGRGGDDGDPGSEVRTVSGDTASIGGGGQEGKLLTAAEKLQELQGLVARFRAEAALAAREAEDVRAEKVSMEFLLREKLEQLVQSEIEARLSEFRREQQQQQQQQQGGGGGGGGGDPALAERTISALKEELKNRNAELQRLNETLHHGPSNQKLATLEERCGILANERQAMHQIMDQKIRVLVEGIQGSLAELPDLEARAAGQRAARDLRALGRLVAAAAAALRAAARDDDARRRRGPPGQGPGPGDGGGGPGEAGAGGRRPAAAAERGGEEGRRPPAAAAAGGFFAGEGGGGEVDST